MARSPDRSATWTLWLWWVLANTAGLLLGLTLGLSLAPASISIARALGLGATDDQRITIGIVPVVGISLAVAQWLALRRHVPRSGWWVVATVAGWLPGTGVAMTGVTLSFEPGLARYLIEFGLIGLGLGIPQWLVLRRQVSHAGWWVLASLAGWAVWPLIFGRAITSGVELTAVAAAQAAITGSVLVWLLRRPLSGAPGLPRSAV